MTIYQVNERTSYGTNVIAYCATLDIAKQIACADIPEEKILVRQCGTDEDGCEYLISSVGVKALDKITKDNCEHSYITKDGIYFLTMYRIVPIDVIDN